jgi:hypothetical protein
MKPDIALDKMSELYQKEPRVEEQKEEGRSAPEVDP